MTPQTVLAQSLVLPNGSVIKNRLAKSAMSEAMATTEGTPTEAFAELYGQWARGGLGLCITGNVMIDRRALGEPGNVVIESERDLVELSRWAQAGTQSGTQLWMQLNHPGKQSPKGLNVENVAPSAVPTEGTRRNRNVERDAQRVARTPLGRLGTVDDIASIVCFLAGDDSAFLTGQTIAADGGYTTANLLG